MIIGGFQKVSLIDYPGKISSIIFTQGCNFSCVYCHNKELININNSTENTYKEKEIIEFLKQRTKKIDAVVITGGEPTLQKDLIPFMKQIKELDFLVKLDSNGTNPDVLKEAINSNLVDYIAMDIKAPLEKYSSITKTNVDIEKIKESINLIKNSGIQHEFRTTVLKSLLTEQDILSINSLTSGANLFTLQKYVPSKDLEKELGVQVNYSDEDFLNFQRSFKSLK